VDVQAEDYLAQLPSPTATSTVAHLSEALEVEDEDVGQCPQTHLQHALLKLLTVGTLPGIIWI